MAAQAIEQDSLPSRRKVFRRKAIKPTWNE